MEKHNTHIVYDSFTSEKHEYKGDEYGNLKVDSNDDIVYRTYVKPKGKSIIKDILQKNNEDLKNEFEQRMAYLEEEPKKRTSYISESKYTKILKKEKLLKQNNKNNKKSNTELEQRR